MIILGLNAYHGDSSACIFVNNKIVAAAEEERFNRNKHYAGIPIQAVKFCLNYANVNVSDVDYITINRNPKNRIFFKLLYLFQNKFKISQIISRLGNLKKITSIKVKLEEHFNSKINAKIIKIDHHLSHISSGVHFGPFDECNFVSVDGFGDFASTVVGKYQNDEIKIYKEVTFPHSLGLFYTAITQYLGFPKYGDEYKMMGLASYGNPSLYDEINSMFKDDDVTDLFKLNLKYFLHHKGKVEMTWHNEEPTVSKVFSDELIKLLGPNFDIGVKVDQKAMDIASSAQKVYEDKLFKLCNYIQKRNQSDNLVLIGGCAMNSVANGKVKQNTQYKNIYIPFAPSDAGGSIGSASFFINKKFKVKKFSDNPYLGPKYQNHEIKNAIDENSELKTNPNILITEYSKKKVLLETAKLISQKKVVGFFSERMEFGARALGNRSILADPREENIRSLLNLKIKRRESFRPFAPSILSEMVSEWFEIDEKVPFMSQVIKIKKEKRDIIPAVTHIDGTGRLQTVNEKINENYYNLIKYFYELTGVPMVLNTSFNENEPIVCDPKEALNCFMRTKMDALIIENFIVYRNE